MTFHQRLRGVWQASRSLVCVGIDPELEKIPEHLRDYEEPLLEFGKGIVDGTAPFVCAFKPQAAHFAAAGCRRSVSQTDRLHSR